MPTDSTDYTAVFGSVNVAVARVAATVTSSSTINPSIYGDTVTFTFRFSGSGAVPTGTANIIEDGESVTTLTLDASGQVTFTTSALTAGGHTIQAVYSGDTNYF